MLATLGRFAGGGYFLAQNFAKRNVDDSYQNLDIIEGADAPTDTSKTWGDSGTGYITSWAGSGSKEDPYLITCAEELAGLSYMAQTNGYYGTYFKQTRDIDLKNIIGFLLAKIIVAFGMMEAVIK